ncbi:hypothetical protein BDV93DRAFT_526028 [Ceratobasidium sp. AG-I]|nr:hypothetical protein BDV93DRAFT_526028 [Ceratobasidium sp. AG-I]
MPLTYMPPKLPAYLEDAFELKPVVGVPTDDEVKNIHALIRTVENASQVPALCNPAFSMELAQHLFDVQLARHREKYPINIFPSGVTYTPPALPSHINVSLGPVVGPPSDDEIKSVHTALRTSENLANIPSMFNSDLSMNISQHLFDIQFARHIQRSNEGRYMACESGAGMSGSQDAAANVSPPPAERIRVPMNYTPDTESAIELTAVSRPDPPSISPDTNVLLAGTSRVIEQLKANQEQNDRLMTGIQEALKTERTAITQMMIKLHNHSARGSNTCDDHTYHHIVNEYGEAPTNCRVPGVCTGTGYYFWCNMSDSEVAQYLQFYNIGLNFIQQGNPTTLRSGCKEAACVLLGRYTHTRGVWT